MLVASSGADPLTLIDPNPALLLASVAVIAATAVFYLACAALSRPGHPDPAEPTMDLGPEPPAVVELITGGFEVTAQAVPATLLDLAARDLLTIEEVQPDRPIVRTRSAPTEGHAAEGGSLTDYERRVMQHVEALAVDGVVPTEALTTGPDAQSREWWAAFRGEVVGDARRRGLCRSRWSRRALSALTAGSLGGGGLLYLSARAGHDRPADGAIPPASFLALVAAGVGACAILAAAVQISRRDPQSDTDAGLVAAGHWLGVRRYLLDQGDFAEKPAASVALWDRYLAYAAALGLAPLTVAQLPLGAEDDRHAWSHAGGAWRRVTVRYPRLRPAWGMRPGVAIARNLVVGAPCLLAARFLLRLASHPPYAATDGMLDASGARRLSETALVVGILLGAVAGWLACGLLLAASDVGRRMELAGVVLRVRPGRSQRALERLAGSLRGASPGATTPPETDILVYVAVDAGRSPRCTAWLVDARVAAGAHEGDAVVARVTPRLGHVFAIEKDGTST